MRDAEPNTDTGPIDELLPQHQALIDASGIAPNVAHERGYRSVLKKTELKRLGFTDQQANVPALLMPVHGVHGDTVLYQTRPDEPRIVKGKPLKYEMPKGSRMALDVPARARGQIHDPGIPLFITEGIRKADAAVSRELCTVALLGVWNWRGTNDRGGKIALPDWESIALNQRQVYVVFDSDVMTKPQVAQALDRFIPFLESRGAIVNPIYMPAGPHGAKVGLDDFLASGRSVDDLLHCAREPSVSVTAAGASDDDPDDPTQATLLVELANELFDLGQDTEQAPFAIAKDRPGFALPIKGIFRTDLAKAYFRRYGVAPGGRSLTDAQTTLHGLATEEPPTVLDLRVALHDGHVYLDLGRADGCVVRIRAGRWDIVDTFPVTFRRTTLIRELPLPAANGSVDHLRAILNVTAETWPLVLGWLLAAFVPGVPHPILLLGGPQGVGKTTAARVITSLVDPSPAPVRSPPSTARQWAITAAASWCFCIDNVSEISAWWSDALCKAVTGDGWLDRTLFTDSEVSVLCFQRVMCFTSIDTGSLRGDLGERVILADLEPIAQHERKTEKDILSEADRLRPSILGALLTLLAKALEELPRSRPKVLPRMADFASLLCAMDRVLGTNAFQIYLNQEARVADEVIQSDPVAVTIYNFAIERGQFIGTATTLLAALTTKERIPGWPRTPRALSGHLRRIVPALRNLGIEVTFYNETSAQRNRMIQIVNRSSEKSAAEDQSDDDQPSASDTEDASDGR